MLKRTINYEDFEGNPKSKEFYFNVSPSEVVEMEVEYPGGFAAAMSRIVNANDEKAIVAEFKKLILFAYGEKSEDGERFVKSDEIRERFTQTAAYSALFMELASDDGAAVAFLQGVMPKDSGVPDQDKPVGPPPTPSTALTPPALPGVPA